MVSRRWRHFDYVLLVVTLFLIALGVVMIYSATVNTPELEELTRRQLIYAVVGLGLMGLTAVIDYRLLSSLGLVLYCATLGMLGVVFVVGQVLVGAQRWIDLGLSIQPSELAKLLTIIVLAKFLSDHVKGNHAENHKHDRLKRVGPSGATHAAKEYIRQHDTANNQRR